MVSSFLALGSVVAGLFGKWVGVFLAPLQNSDMLWLLIPVYVGWGFTEFYQEKRGTSLGNAITNGAIPLLVGFGWSRQVVTQGTQTGMYDHVFFTKLGIALLAFLYGLFVIYRGVKSPEGNVRFFGRIRMVTYLVVVLTPIYYGALEPSIELFAAILLFFPLYYGIIELIDVFVPDPRSIVQEQRDAQQQAQAAWGASAQVQSSAFPQQVSYAYNPYYAAQSYGQQPYAYYQYQAALQSQQRRN